ncbi:BamA/TamA family outer membrane protein [Candidatus Cardinium hertigii]|uniref:BamA/TamA family outer membrane protein n=1 Tax=Candidatus Cardinium hertigii TaxID=247481 RepID=UPI003D7EA254
MLHAAIGKPLPIKEVIVGVNHIHKKGLQKHSIYHPATTFLGMPIRKWLYQWGDHYFNLEKIKNQSASIEATYAYRISKAANEKEKKKLIAKRDKAIKRKQELAAKGNHLMRMGEKPLYYDPTYVHHNEKIFLNYLHSKGYLDAEVTSKTDLQKSSARVTYYINLKKLYKIASIRLQTTDQAIGTLLGNYNSESLIKIGDSYTYENFVNEQERIINLLSDNGYFEFNEQYVHFIADRSDGDHTIAVTTVVDLPNPKMAYHKTKIGRIVVDLTTQKDHASCITPLLTKVCQGLYFLVPSDGYPLDDIAAKIPLRPGDLYNKSKILETYERLHRIATFGSIAILPKIEGDQLVIYIHAKPDERVRIQTEIGGECVNFNLNKLRPAIKLNPIIRRVRGLGILQIEASVARREEFVIQKSYQNTTYGLRGKFTTPCFMLFLSKKTNLMLEKLNPSTTMTIDYSFTKNRGYSSKKIDSGLNYNWYSKHVLYECAPFKVTFDYPQVLDDSKINQSHIKLPSFLTSMGCILTIRSAMPALYFNPLVSYRWMILIDIEHGGLYEHLFPVKKILHKEIQLYKYFKIEMGYQHAFDITAYTRLVYQAKLGAVKGYKATDKIPLDKQYTIGGYGSVRAWERGMIGPGLYESEEDNKERQKGNLLLLGNIELRRKLIGYLEGALFLDMGNTWKLGKDAPLKMKFKFHKFYKAFAVGGGFGLRLNLYNIFILCGDLAFPLHRPSGSKLQKLKPIFNLNIGYPF